MRPHEPHSTAATYAKRQNDAKTDYGAAKRTEMLKRQNLSERLQTLQFYAA